ncbi:MAG: hypothetical protein ACRCR4_09935 [Thiotrichaceae bacterium]
MLSLEIGDDEDPILRLPDSPELDDLREQGMALICNEREIMLRRGEAITAWDKAQDRGDDMTEFDAKWKAVEREIAENTAKREAIAQKSQNIVAALMAEERRKLAAEKAARLRGQA